MAGERARWRIGSAVPVPGRFGADDVGKGGVVEPRGIEPLTSAVRLQWIDSDRRERPSLQGRDRQNAMRTSSNLRSQNGPRKPLKEE